MKKSPIVKTTFCDTLFRAGLLAAALASSQLCAAPPPGSWSPTLDENFDGTTLNTAIWSKGMRYANAVNNELQAYRPENVNLANGRCTITVNKVRGFINNPGGYPAGATVLNVDNLTAAIPNGTILTIQGQSRKFKTVSTVGGNTPTQITILRLTDTFQDDVGGLTDPVPDNGQVTVTAKMSDQGNYQWGAFDYRAGALQTYNKWAQTNGYFEARIRMASGKGTWPTFWLLPDRGASSPNLYYRTAVGNTWYIPDGSDPDDLPDATGTCPMGTEIDVFEYMGSWKNTSTGLSKAHSGYIWKYNQTGAVFADYTKVNQLTNPDTEFHTYGAYWSSGKMIFYVDGHVVLGRNDSTYVSVVPEYMILNCAVSTNDWSGTAVPLADIDAGLPCSMDIEYVRAYAGTATDFITYEAESVAAVTSSDPISNINEPGASNGSFEILGSNLANDQVTYTLPVAAAGTYSVHVGLKKANSRGKFQLSVDGVNVGGEQDEYVNAPAFATVDVGSVTFSTAGNKQFKFTVTGKNPASTGYSLGTDFIRLYPETPAVLQKVETESVATVTASDAVTVISDGVASGSAYEMLQSNAANDQVTYTVPVASPGTYDIRVRCKRYNNRGIFQLAIDGVNQGTAQDVYSDTQNFITFDLGSKMFTTAGDKQFKFTVTGKNGSSLGWWLALDSIELQQ